MHTSMDQDLAPTTKPVCVLFVLLISKQRNKQDFENLCCLGAGFLRQVPPPEHV